MSWPERCYRGLLLLYPEEFRYEYAGEMTQLFRERWRAESRLPLFFDLVADVILGSAREHFQMLLNDLRYALRSLRKTPMFAAAAVLTLALGIGANTAIFSVVNAVLLRPLPFANPERLVLVNEKNDKLRLPNFGSSVLNYLSWKEQAQSFESMAAIGAGNYNLTGRVDPENFGGAAFSPSLLPLLGIQPVAGRGFREGEDRPGAAPVAIISESLWKRRFGGEASLLGGHVTLNGVVYTVVGIAPAALAVLLPGDIWTPLTIDPAREQRLNHVISTVARLKPGVTLRQAQAEMDTVAHRVGQQYPEVRDWGINLVTFFRTFVSPRLQTALLVLLGAVVLVLLIACANVANLLLSRAAARQTEIAVRTAMGAGRGRIVRQLLTESMLLSTTGGAAGLLAALWTIRLINRGLPPNLLPIPAVPIDGGVLLFGLMLTAAAGIVFGLAPAWHASRTDLNAILKQGGRSGGGAARALPRNLLVGAELALSTVLLIGAGLLVQTLLKLERVTLGFRPEGLLTFQVSPPPARYRGPDRQWAFYHSLIESLESIPGVRAAGVSSGLPMGNGNYTATATAPVGPAALPVGEALTVEWRAVSPGFFHAMEIPLLRGRTFTEQDTPSSPRVAIISQLTARRFWGDADPLGHMLRLIGSGLEFTVVGVVGDTRSTALATDPAPAMYFPAAFRTWPVMDIALRVAGNPDSALPAVRHKVHELDPELPLATVRTMDAWVSSSAAQSRLNAVLLGAFAAVALAIAAIGVYGVLSYSVNRRIREIGLRMALGARQGSVVRLVVREGMIVALAGIAAGLAAAFALKSALTTILFGVQADDPRTFAGVAAVLAGIALVACLLPARRAARIDPVVALREE
ncbi:MAG TPA: ABC transporter permease [Bryobacteraceae bacterium]